MSRIESTFKELKGKGQAALIPFIIAGDPNLEATEALVLKMAECGADIIELGLPFSDPLADGPTLQAASQRALQNGIRLRDLFRLTEKLHGVAPPLVLICSSPDDCRSSIRHPKRYILRRGCRR